MKSCPYSVSQLLAHDTPMVLIDQVECYDDENIYSNINVTENSPFLYGETVPSYIAVEYMAQTIACYSGVQARNGGNEVRIGFLLGTRKLKLYVDEFHVGDNLLVKAKILYNDGEMAAFDCHILNKNKIVAEAKLNVYQPENPEWFESN
jgi:predicted hotdog family 3-hydroxylacyl-ACP dehydratase